MSDDAELALCVTGGLDPVMNTAGVIKASQMQFGYKTYGAGYSLKDTSLDTNCTS